MKICFVCNGVVTRHSTMKRAFGLGDALAKLGHQVYVVMENHPDNLARLKLTTGVEAMWYESSHSARVTRNRKIKLLQEQQFDIIHICGLGWRNALNPKRIQNARMIMDHVEIESCLDGASILRKWMQHWLEFWALRAYKEHVCASKYLTTIFRHQSLLRRLPGRYLYLPYASEVWGSAVQERVHAVRSRFGRRKILLYLGGLYRNYGFYDMLNMARDVVGRGYSISLLIVGRGPEYAAGQNWIEENNLVGVISLEGYVLEEDLASYLRAADIFICPLHNTVVDWARCPSKLLTYVAYSRPIVTASIGEAVEYLGTSAFYFEPGDHNSFVDAVLRALNATDTWEAPYNVNAHTWLTRAIEYTQWIQRRT